MEENKEENMIIEKGFSKIDKLKKKINEKHYVGYAINRIASDICEGFFRRFI